MQKVYDSHHQRFNVLNLGGREGSTGYIDFIEKSEVPHKVMVGVDKFGREFIVLKCIVTRRNGNKINCFQTFFRRYVSDKELWASGSSWYDTLLMTVGGINSDQTLFLDDLLENESVEVNLTAKSLTKVKFCCVIFDDDPNENPPVKVELSAWE